MIRISSVLLVIWLAATLSFLLLHVIPGDPAEAALSQTIVSEQALEIRREALGLNLPLGAQYWRFLTKAVSGNFGVSWVTGQSVSLMIAQQIVPTLQLALIGMCVTVILGGILGFVAGASQFAITRGVSMGFIGMLIAVPIMFSATILLWVLDTFGGSFQVSVQGGTLLPALVVGAAGAGTLALPISLRLWEIENEQFILAARARGASRSRLVARHMAPHAVLAGLDIAALMIGYLIGGTVVTEMIFARPGLGRTLLSAVLNQDIPVVQAVVVLSAVVYGAVNIAADILRGWIDPRVRIS